jgi:hypothetical protein
MEEDRMLKKVFTEELEGTRRRGRPRKRWKEEVERDLQVLGVRRWRELVADKKKMAGHCSTGQSPQLALVPMEEEVKLNQKIYEPNISYSLRGNGTGMASNHYGLVCHACRHISAQVRNLCHLPI